MPIVVVVMVRGIGFRILAMNGGGGCEVSVTVKEDGLLADDDCKPKRVPRRNALFPIYGSTGRQPATN
ncbi:hypothetical protein Tco_1163248 [Tanacetum coccineum]